MTLTSGGFRHVFLTVYESGFEKEYGHFRHVVKEVVERYLDCGLYANAHRGKVRKAGHVAFVPGLIEEAPPPMTSKGWAEMIRKVYEVDPMVCPECSSDYVCFS